MTHQVASLRDALGLSQGQLAQLAGMSREQINRIEAGKRGLSYDEAVDLALALGVSLEELRPAPARIQFRGRLQTDETNAAIELIRNYVRNWQMIDSLQALETRASDGERDER